MEARVQLRALAPLHLNTIAQCIAKFSGPGIGFFCCASSELFVLLSNMSVCVCAQIHAKRCDRAIKFLRRSEKHELRKMWTFELVASQARNDYANVYRLSRLLAGGVGPKRRKLNLPMYMGDRESWRTLLAKPGSEGGCLASDLPVHNSLPFVPPLRSFSSEAIDYAKQDRQDIRHRMWKVKLRRTPPRWSFPSAIWRMLMWPNRFRKQIRSGVGYTEPPISNPLFQKGFFWLCVSIRAHARIPHVWNTSCAFSTPKGKGLDLKGLRLLHCLDGFSKVYMACMWHNSGLDRIAHRSYSSGYAPKRRREQSILTQMLLASRLSNAKISFVQDSYDATNAFASINSGLLRAVVSAHSHCPHATSVLHQRTHEANFILPCVDGDLCMLIQSGTLPGDSVAGIWFLCVYHKAVDGFLAESNSRITLSIPWLHRCICDNSEQLMLWQINQHAIDVSASGYADDLFRTTLVRSYDELVCKTARNDRLLEFHLGGVGVSTNWGKRMSLVRFYGVGAQAHQRRAFDSGASLSLRYLGPLLRFDGGLKCELGARKNATRAGFAQLGAFWRSNAPEKWKFNVFNSMCTNLLASGVAAMAPHDQFVSESNTVHVKLLRQVLKGGACNKEGPHFVAMSNKEVLRRANASDMFVFLRMQRLKWWQKIVLQPMSNVQVLAVMFGQARWEPRPPVSSTGRFTGFHNRWTSQFRDDLEALFSACDNEICLPALELPSALFTCEHIRDSFLSLDVSAIKSAANSVCIPPPNWSAPSSPLADVSLSLPFVCPHEESSEPRCPRFKSSQALSMHLVRRHGEQNLAQALTCANACIVCGNIYTSKMYAARHLARCIQTGMCPRSQGSVSERQIKFSLPIKCGVCKLEFDHYVSARAHLCSHLPAEIEIEL
jgi:hypothetical protein